MHSAPDSLEELRAAFALQQRQIAAVHRISSLLSSTLDLDQRLKDILQVSLEAVGASAGSILTYRESDQMLVFQHVEGEKSGELTGQAIPADQGVSGQVFQSGEPQITNRPKESSAHLAEIDEQIQFTTTGMITVPLKFEAGRPVGVLQLLNKQDGDFTPQDLEVLEIIASMAATSIYNAQLQKESQAAAIAHMLGNLSHDIKNKVSPIYGWIETLDPLMQAMFEDLDSVLLSATPELRAQVKAVTHDVRTLYPEGFKACLEQINIVQEYTKLIADALKGSISEPKFEPYDVLDIIEQQLRELDGVAKQRGVGLVRAYGPPVTIRVDRLRMQQAVYNLVNNAIPETPPGGSVTVRTSVVEEGSFPDGGYLLIEVKDTGRGMPRKVLDSILRGDAKSSKAGGSGLGTRIVYNAVLSHKGKFEGESAEGVGTTFRIKLPLNR